VSIILLTLSIKLLFVPLQYKSYKSMKDMQVIQPKVAALQTKYKDDRERLNRELIRLYRDHKVNPVGGCLPMLLQMPVFVALFNILYMTIDLRQAPFILWIRDLSAPDPYYVLPILMGVSMVIQQKIMPTTMDPTQAKIMLLLPAFMTVLFLTFPSGLVLYWLTNNVITILQQFLTDRYIMPKPAPAVSPAQDAGPSDGQKSGGKKKKPVSEQTAEADQREAVDTTPDS
jgi:YidC/Oxa1 family membrane protein insertase